jgi:hypothetical protein
MAFIRCHNREYGGAEIENVVFLENASPEFQFGFPEFLKLKPISKFENPCPTENVRNAMRICYLLLALCAVGCGDTGLSPSGVTTHVVPGQTPRTGQESFVYHPACDPSVPHDPGTCAQGATSSWVVQR